MGQNKTDKFIADYCRGKNIRLLLDPGLCKDNGLCYPDANEIHLAKKYSSTRIKLAIFLHELGHIAVDKRRKKPFNSFECELMSWQYAIWMHKRLFGKYFSQSQAKFMLKCLTSYSNSRNEFRRTKLAPSGV